MPPPCCTRTSVPGAVHDPVWTVTQYATADLIGRIAYDGYDPGDDPEWESSGAPTRNIYARWCRHMCGIACLRMVLLHRDGHAPTLWDLLTGACRYGAYVQQDDRTIKGLIYKPFVEYVADTHRLPGEVHGELDLDGVVDLLGDGRMVMVSVSKEIRRPDVDPERRGGHLVLAIGRRDGQIILRNPSGHTPEALAPALPLDRFGAFFGGRGISLDPRSTVWRRTAPTAVSRPVASQSST